MATSTAPPAPVRLENTTACLPIVTGSCAFFLPKRAEGDHTHQWTLYLRGPNNEDLSPAISKVVFTLHSSFDKRMIQDLTEPPFEVTERGWGEFDALIRIVWRDASEQATVVRR
jgi:YEATS domain-containing protein 4